MVSGEPVPTVTWGRNKGTVDEPKYQTRYDERTQEHILEVRERYLNKTLHISLKKRKKKKYFIILITQSTLLYSYTS